VKELRLFTTETPRRRELKRKWAFSGPLARNFFAAGEESKDAILGEARRSEESRDVILSMHSGKSAVRDVRNGY
jgi:hypothetical protein